MPLRVLRREFKRRLVGRCYQLEELAKKYHNAYILALIIDRIASQQSGSRICTCEKLHALQNTHLRRGLSPII
jgi:hypothetical protein